jgi:hypothetical protein
MLANQFFRKAWPCGEVASSDGFDPSVRYWAEGCCMKESDQFLLVGVFMYIVCLTHLDARLCYVNVGLLNIRKNYD